MNKFAKILYIVGTIALLFPIEKVGPYPVIITLAVAFVVQAVLPIPKKLPHNQSPIVDP